MPNMKTSLPAIVVWKLHLAIKESRGSKKVVQFAPDLDCYDKRSASERHVHVFPSMFTSAYDNPTHSYYV